MNTKWYWDITDGESMHVVETRQEALDSAAEQIADQYGDGPDHEVWPSVTVGECSKVRPGDHLRPLDLDDLLEQMEEHANDEGSTDPDGSIFDLLTVDAPAAKEALAVIHAQLVAWANEHIKSRWYMPDTDEDVTEEVHEIIRADAKANAANNPDDANEERDRGALR